MLDNFEIEDQKIIDFFNELKTNKDYDKKQLYEKMISLLHLGCIAQQTIETGDKVNYIKESFVSLKKDMESQIKHNFSDAIKNKIDVFLGEKGSFTTELRETFGTDGKHSQKIDDLIEEQQAQINLILNLNNQSSPFNILIKLIEEKFTNVLTIIQTEETRKNAENKSIQKGAKFEEFMSPILSNSSMFFNCNFQNMTGISGISGDKNSKKGDFVLTEKNCN